MTGSPCVTGWNIDPVKNRLCNMLSKLEMVHVSLQQGRQLQDEFRSYPLINKQNGSTGIRDVATITSL